ncbi:MAG: hypothetical protein IJ079_03890 [Lachnospiraceae bacterium]|nr:hypothetical protein [Lachnospiraceae bacterium]MBR1567550.1 hypothetical protein [Lachnospiraceae bacterium]MBR1568706.1 hypothetical protein [Lachnospiraceae bacterium]
MGRIGGNTTIKVQIMALSRNRIGESIASWTTEQLLTGWLDLMSEEVRYNTFSAKVPDSSHVFICDYEKLSDQIQLENSRVVDEDGLIYDIKMIDDPMKLHEQLEIYLNYTGERL